MQSYLPIMFGFALEGLETAQEDLIYSVKYFPVN